MRSRTSLLAASACCAILCGLALTPRFAEAAPKAKARPAAPGKPNKKATKQAETAAPASAAGTRAASDDSLADKPDRGEPSAPKAAGTSAAKATPSAAAAAAVQETKESKEGVKTYKFGTIEVESRLKSPQIIYFLRRVRAEFDAGLLGHRSFLRELSDTRNHPSLR
jgi:cobalamin biosynthesis Mg chelatase CobN